MPRRIAYTAFATAAAVLLAACAATPARPPDPYANCLDLGNLSLPSESRADAEARMRARVRELGGDTLVFGDRGRFDRAGGTPEEVAQGRNALVGSGAGGDSRPGIAATTEQRDKPEAPAARETTGGRRRGKVTAQPVEPPPGELWYYGAALRCNRVDLAVLAQTGAAPMPLVRIAPDYDGRADADAEVSLEFTIAITGTTKDIVVVASSAPELEAPAVAALLRWRYAPLIENGGPVERRGVRTTIRFDRKRDPV